MICPMCGDEFDPEEAKKEFDEYNAGRSPFVYDMLPEKCCVDCACALSTSLWLDCQKGNNNP